MKRRAPNPALNPVRFALWTLRDKAAQRRLALRWAVKKIYRCAFLPLQSPHFSILPASFRQRYLVLLGSDTHAAFKLKLRQTLRLKRGCRAIVPYRQRRLFGAIVDWSS
jgi:hypothetical protein